MSRNFKKLNKNKTVMQKMSKYFPKSWTSYKDIKVEFDVFNYAKKSGVKKQQLFINHNLQKNLI